MSGSRANGSGQADGGAVTIAVVFVGATATGSGRTLAGTFSATAAATFIGAAATGSGQAVTGVYVTPDGRFFGFVAAGTGQAGTGQAKDTTHADVTIIVGRAVLGDPRRRTGDPALSNRRTGAPALSSDRMTGRGAW